MTPEQQVARRKRVVKEARALLSLQSGLVYGCRRIVGALGQLGYDLPSRFPKFDSFLRSIPLDLPTGDLRLHCQQALLMKSDKLLAKLEVAHRAAILQECLNVIHEFRAEQQP